MTDASWNAMIDANFGSVGMTQKAPERIALRWELGAAVTSGPLMTHPDYTQYIRADLAPDAALVAELVEAAKGIALLVDCDIPGEPDRDSIGWQNGNEPIPVTFGQVRAFFAVLAKLEGKANG